MSNVRNPYPAFAAIPHLLLLQKQTFKARFHSSTTANDLWEEPNYLLYLMHYSKFFFEHSIGMLIFHAKHLCSGILIVFSP